MKYIIVPPPVAVTTIDGNAFIVVSGPNGAQRIELEKASPFEDFVINRLVDAKFTTGMAGILSALKVREAVYEAKKTGILALEDADYAILKSAVESPSPLPNGQGAYQTGLAHNLAPFMRAIVEGSTDKKPDVVAPVPAEATTPNAN